jgi:hypothetical protein
MSSLRSLIEKGLGILEEIGELTDSEDDNAISEAYKKVLEDLEHLKYLVLEESNGTVTGQSRVRLLRRDF